MVEVRIKHAFLNTQQLIKLAIKKLFDLKLPTHGTNLATGINPELITQ